MQQQILIGMSQIDITPPGPVSRTIQTIREQFGDTRASEYGSQQ